MLCSVCTVGLLVTGLFKTRAHLVTTPHLDCLWLACRMGRAIHTMDLGGLVHKKDPYSIGNFVH